MLGAPAAACIVTLAATPIVIVCMRRLAAIDEVTARSSHQAPTPRGGGIAVVLGLFAGVLVMLLTRGGTDSPDLLPLTAAASLFGLIGLAEDVGGVTAMRRLALHTATSFVVAAMAVLGAVLGDATPGLLTVLLVTVAAPVWITGFVNVFNFMDGVNGISAVTAALAGGAFAALGAAQDLPTATAGGVLVAASALGFLPFNFPRARVFLGDVGSYALGAVLAVLTVQAVLAGIPPESALAPTALYLTDTTATLARRIRAGEQWYSPHRSHAYQRLTIAGWSHVRVTGLVAAATAVLIALSLAAFGPLPGRLAADAAAGLVLLAYLRAPRWAARRGRTAAHPLTARPAAPSPHQPARLPAQRRTDDEPDRRAAPGRTR
ncbi:glycosyltransferase family 4 protein [Frankia sp. ACN1ag]|uniref:MraY family glycosyltransferase n=1 Tax=Frankia sp. ACN1ag TaxID=102891 RepID=UPI0006DCA42E|nr:glycosyltransferase family 4 protein [Frankia sp. ACN1ag]